MCEHCNTICKDFLEIESSKLREQQEAVPAGEKPLSQKLEELQNAYTGAGASIESEREKMLYDFLLGIGLLKFFVGERKVLPTETREEVLRNFSIPETEKPIAFADTSLMAVSKNARKTGLVFGLNGIYTHDKKFTAGMPYETFKNMDIRVKKTFLNEYVDIGDNFRVDLRGQIHSNIAKNLQALQKLV